MNRGIENFLGVKVSEEIVVNEQAKISFLDEAEVSSSIFEKPPQLYVEKAIVYDSHDDSSHHIGALGTVLVSDEMCGGHFDFFPMLPLAILGQAVAQVGELLILSMGNGDVKVPLVIEVGKIKSISKRGKGKKFIVPGDRMLVSVHYIGGKFSIHKVNADIFVDGDIMGMMRDITYVNVEKNHFKEE